MKRVTDTLFAFLLLAGLSFVVPSNLWAENPPQADSIAELKKSTEEVKKEAVKGQARGDNSWMLTSSAFVFLMVPGLALFYGGMVRRKNVLGTMMHSFAALSVVGLYWVIAGYSLAFGNSILRVSILGVEQGGIVGWDWRLFFLKGIDANSFLPGTNIPVYTHVMFQGMFAIITPALISGAFAERIRFWPWCIFMILWVTIVYCPLAHMVWAFDWFAPFPQGDVDANGNLPDLGATAIGLLGKMGALDFAGGTVVHIAAGIAGLVGCLILRKRSGYPEHAMHPNSMVLTLLGAGLLWFGWFGFNGGSGLNSSELSSSGFAATQAAAAAAGLSWIIAEWLVKGKPTALGLASGVVAGLVAVTPASGFVYAWGGAIIGLFSGVICFAAIHLKTIFGYDDSLDAFGVHGVGGFVGALLTGIFCYASVQSASADGTLGYLWTKNRPNSITAEQTKLKAQNEVLEKQLAEAKKADDKKAVAIAQYQLDSNANTLKALETELEQVNDKLKEYEEKKRGPLTQFWIQVKASLFSVLFAGILSVGLVALVHVVTGKNFTTSLEHEQEGLDRTEHGEVGFDLGLALDSVPTGVRTEPKAAKVPPGGKRFEIVVEGVENGNLIHAWSELCQPSDNPPSAEFKSIYPYVTTVQGNRFRLRGGDPKTLSVNIQKLFSEKLNQPNLKVRIEE